MGKEVLFQLYFLQFQNFNFAALVLIDNYFPFCRGHLIFNALVYLQSQ